MLIAAALASFGCSAGDEALTLETGAGDTGGPGTDEQTVTEDQVTLSEVQEKVFTPHCATSNCHDAAAPRTPHLVEGESWSDLVNVRSTAVPTATLVVPGEPTNSYLAMKLNGTIGIDGVQMPFGSTMDPLLVTLVEKWILAGALDN